MCGIVYAHDFGGKSVNNVVLDQFDAQRRRGVQGFGLFDGQFGNIVKNTTEDGILKWMCKYDSNLLLFHHRFPTSTKNTKDTAHPFTTKDYFLNTEYILVHNGHISNDWELKTTHEKAGINYQSEQKDYTFNDSEALLWDFALYAEGKQSGLYAKGNIAFVCIKLVDGVLDKLYFGRNNNPLHLYREKIGIMLSSEGPGEMIDADQLYTWSYTHKRLTQKYLQIEEYKQYSPPKQKALPPPYSSGYSGGWGYGYNDYEDDEDEYNDQFQIPDNPTAAQIEDCALRYLIINDGNFELAYNDLELDYMQVAEDAVTLEELEEMKLFEGALRYIEYDPEWLNPQSISSLYTQLSLKGV